MAKKKSSTDPLTVYQSLVDKTPNLEIKGAKSNYTSLNGNMFSFLSTENQLALRFSDDDRTAFLAKHPGMECYQYGALMKHYVMIPETLLDNKRQMNALFKKCYANAQSLKPKPTKRAPAKSAKKPTKSVAKKSTKKATKKARKKK